MLVAPRPDPPRAPDFQFYRLDSEAGGSGAIHFEVLCHFQFYRLDSPAVLLHSVPQQGGGFQFYRLDSREVPSDQLLERPVEAFNSID